MTIKMFLLLTLLFVATKPCSAINPKDDELLSLINLSAETATQEKVTSVLGQPTKIEEGKKRTMWYYTHDNTSLVIYWSKKSDLLEKFSYNCEKAEKCIFDNKVSRGLKSGATDLLQALKLLGTPKDMTVKEGTQELHYAYQHNVLRLFFRDRVLVDYCLY